MSDMQFIILESQILGMFMTDDKTQCQDAF